MAEQVAGVLLRLRGEHVEDGGEPPDRVRGAADHHAVADLQAPDPAARADVDVVDVFATQFLRAGDVVDVVRVAAVDDAVAGFQERRHGVDALSRDARRHHQPNRARLSKFADEVL